MDLQFQIIVIHGRIIKILGALLTPILHARLREVMDTKVKGLLPAFYLLWEDHARMFLQNILQSQYRTQLHQTHIYFPMNLKLLPYLII